MIIKIEINLKTEIEGKIEGKLKIKTKMQIINNICNCNKFAMGNIIIEYNKVQYYWKEINFAIYLCFFHWYKIKIKQ